MIDRFDQAYTDHCVDDLPPQDIAMDAFIKAFNLTCVWVEEDGKTARYRLKRKDIAHVWEANAKKIIASMNLPLEASVEIWQRGDVAFEVNLCIEYKPV